MTRRQKGKETAMEKGGNEKHMREGKRKNVISSTFYNTFHSKTETKSLGTKIEGTLAGAHKMVYFKKYLVSLIKISYVSTPTPIFWF